MTHPKTFSLFRPKIEDPFPRRVGESAFRLPVTLNESVWLIHFKNLKRADTLPRAMKESMV